MPPRRTDSTDAPPERRSVTPNRRDATALCLRLSERASVRLIRPFDSLSATVPPRGPSSQSPGHLVNGTFALPQPLQGLGTVKTYNAPVSNDQVTVQFKQQIGANDALRTGTYAKTLTFTLSTTSP